MREFQGELSDEPASEVEEIETSKSEKGRIAKSMIALKRLFFGKWQSKNPETTGADALPQKKQ